MRIKTNRRTDNSKEQYLLDQSAEILETLKYLLDQSAEPALAADQLLGTVAVD